MRDAFCAMLQQAWPMKPATRMAASGSSSGYPYHTPMSAHSTVLDVLTSSTVLCALIGVWYGYPLLDPLAAILVAGFIGHACWSIAQNASRILADQIVIAEADVREVVQ